MSVATATGQPVRTIIREPAARTLWTYLELEDTARVDTLVRRAERYEEAGLSAVAAWDGKAFTRLESDFRSELKKSPDPEVERKRLADLKEQSRRLIESVSVIGGRK